MASVNKWIGIGNLTKDPEIRYLQSGEAVTNITVACNEQWKDRVTGEKKESVEFVRVVLYRRLAEIADQYLRKGSSVYIEGRIKTRKWQDKDGQDRYTTEIEATEMQMLGGGRVEGIRQGGDGVQHPPAPHQADQQKPASTSKPDIFDGLDDDIPF